MILLSGMTDQAVAIILVLGLIIYLLISAVVCAFLYFILRRFYPDFVAQKISTGRKRSFIFRLYLLSFVLSVLMTMVYQELFV